MSDLVLVKFIPKAGAGEQVEAILRGMIAPTRSEPGCLRYDLLDAPGPDSRNYYLLEAYRDEAALLAHRETPHYKAYRAEIMDLLAEPIAVAILRPLDMGPPA